MTIKRRGRLTGVALVGALALTACGSDSTTNAGGGSSSSGSSSGTSSAAGGNCSSGTIDAEGSSAQANAMEEVIASFGDVCPDLTVNYNPTGSGTGIKQLIAGQADFAGSDSALKTEVVDGVVEQQAADKACGSPAWNLPMVTGPIAVSYNLPGVDSLVLGPEVLAKISKGQIKTWDDPAIAALNQGLKLPSTPITVFFRNDESGTTENFTKYLAATAPKTWTDEPSKTWPGTGQGRAKSSGVAESVKKTEGGFTYVELSYAKDNNLGIAQVDNGAGAVTLNGDSASKAVAAAKVVGAGNDLKLQLDYATKAPGAYPIILVTYELVCSKNQDAAKGQAIKTFLQYFASDEAQQSIADIGYAPLPAEISTKVKTAIDALS